MCNGHCTRVTKLTIIIMLDLWTSIFPKIGKTLLLTALFLFTGIIAGCKTYCPTTPKETQSESIQIKFDTLKDTLKETTIIHYDTIHNTIYKYKSVIRNTDNKTITAAKKDTLYINPSLDKRQRLHFKDWFNFFVLGISFLGFIFVIAKIAKKIRHL